jgi:hypothetical protein
MVAHLIMLLMCTLARQARTSNYDQLTTTSNKGVTIYGNFAFLSLPTRRTPSSLALPLSFVAIHLPEDTASPLPSPVQPFPAVFDPLQ